VRAKTACVPFSFFFFDFPRPDFAARPFREVGKCVVQARVRASLIVEPSDAATLPGFSLPPPLQGAFVDSLQNVRCPPSRRGMVASASLSVLGRDMGRRPQRLRNDIALIWISKAVTV
jgi:hypothetical protein